MNHTVSTRKSKKKSKNNNLIIGIIIAVCIIISIYLLSAITIPGVSEFSGKVVYGVNSFFSTIVGFAKDGTSYFGSVKKLNKEINSLKADIEKKDYELLEINTLEKENQDLKGLLEINEKYSHFNKAYASVIFRSYDNWNESFVIDKGAKDGIKEKQTVIAAKGLVGYIYEVKETTSIVKTILDPSTSVSVEIASINDLALTKGDFSLKDMKQMKLVNIPIDSEISISEIVYTSGIGAVYKKGIPVGTISKVVNKKNEIDRYAIVDSLVDFNKLTAVAVIVE